MNPLRARVLLSVQRALLGEIFPALRAVCVAYTDAKLELIFYVDRPIDDADRESISAVETEVRADFDPGHEVATRVIELAEPAAIPRGAECVYLRRDIGNRG